MTMDAELDVEQKKIAKISSDEKHIGVTCVVYIYLTHKSNNRKINVFVLNRMNCLMFFTSQ